jgi:hypothetical protein
MGTIALKSFLEEGKRRAGRCVSKIRRKRIEVKICRVTDLDLRNHQFAPLASFFKYRIVTNTIGPPDRAGF